MYASELELDSEKISEYKANEKKTFFNTKIKFLKEHRGLRPNNLHVLIAPTHSGKSTLMRTLLVDFVFRNKDKKIMLYLSEEKTNEFESEFSNAVPENEVLKNIRILSERDYPDTPVEDIYKQIEQHIEYFNIDLLVIDNITTSKIYNDKTTQEQSKVANWLKGLTTNTTVFVVAHTNGNEHHQGLIRENDIRGSKTIINLSQFLYILQPVHVGKRMFSFLLLKKHRGQEIKNKFFELLYNHELKIFAEQKPTDFEEIARIFKLRNKLGK